MTLRWNIVAKNVMLKETKIQYLFLWHNFLIMSKRKCYYWYFFGFYVINILSELSQNMLSNIKQ